MLKFYLAIVNKMLRHCHFWMSRQYMFTFMIVWSCTEMSFINEYYVNKKWIIRNYR